MSRSAPERPVTRGDCANGPRPCRWDRCRYHLLADFKKEPGASISTIPETCALDVADRGSASRLDVGKALGVTHEMIRQIEVRAMQKLRIRLRSLERLDRHHDPDAEYSISAENVLTPPVDYVINELLDGEEFET